MGNWARVLGKKFMLPKLGLFTGAEQKRGDRVLGEVEESSFYCFARQREPQRANALKTV